MVNFGKMHIERGKALREYGDRQAERHWIILAPFNCTAHGRVRHHQLPKMADALLEFVGSFSLVCAFVQL